MLVNPVGDVVQFTTTGNHAEDNRVFTFRLFLLGLRLLFVLRVVVHNHIVVEHLITIGFDNLVDCLLGDRSYEVLNIGKADTTLGLVRKVDNPLFTDSIVHTTGSEKSLILVGNHLGEELFNKCCLPHEVGVVDSLEITGNTVTVNLRTLLALQFDIGEEVNNVKFRFRGKGLSEPLVNLHLQLPKE